MRSILLTWSNLGLKTQCRACHIVTPDCQIEAVSPMKKEFTGDPSRASPPCPAELWRRERQKNGQISRAVLGGVGNLIWVSKTQRHACHIVTPNCQIEAVAWKRIHGWPIQSLPSLPGRTLAAGEAEKWSKFTGGQSFTGGFGRCKGLTQSNLGLKTQRHACHMVTPNCQHANVERFEAVAWTRIHGWPIESLPSLPGRTLAAGEAEKWSNFTGGFGRCGESNLGFENTTSCLSHRDTQLSDWSSRMKKNSRVTHPEPPLLARENSGGGRGRKMVKFHGRFGAV